MSKMLKFGFGMYSGSAAGADGVGEEVVVGVLVEDEVLVEEVEAGELVPVAEAPPTSGVSVVVVAPVEGSVEVSLQIGPFGP